MSARASLLYDATMPALTTLLPDAKLLSRADKLKLIQLLAEDLATADGPARSSVQLAAGRPPQLPSLRLADPARAVDFIKQVREVAADAAV